MAAGAFTLKIMDVSRVGVTNTVFKGDAGLGDIDGVFKKDRRIVIGKERFRE